MNATETGQLLEKLSAAYPYMTLNPDVVAEWTRHLEPITFDVGRRAVWVWVETQPKPPAISEVLDACRAVLRERRAAQAEKATSTGLSPNGKANVAALRAALEAVRAGGDAVAAFEEARPRTLEPEELWRCHRCRDTGWVEVDAVGHGTYEPCARCRSVTHARWGAGEYAMRSSV